jgi:hypothetical protein
LAYKMAVTMHETRDREILKALGVG